MAHSLTRPVIAGNWKLNHGPGATRDFLSAFAAGEEGRGTVVLFPPALSFAAAVEARADAAIVLGVQNVYWETSGAFTGEVSAPMAREAGAEIVLVGHSERRHVFGETNADTGRKVRAVLDAGLVAMLCVGELIEQREAGQAESVVEQQLVAGLQDVRDSEMDRVAVAYEPVWAIGTGKTATASDASEMHGFVRRHLKQRSPGLASEIPILYGGSVKPENARELLGAPEIDGVLVGGASLDLESFRAIHEAAGLTSGPNHG